ncbi:Linalool 8-monooxygenase [uncultured Mycobacterium sp.]|uniref:Linalool 8-monooxygenase n=1 Tax=uncultured Mycobacterium sp. TaxID=171292 RepID=A0A1Y5NXF1_9MYCO|nr:Linalool 8-monooxygenase [uncultured Mycobacterium sp.]
MTAPKIDDPEFWRDGPDRELAEFRRRCPVAELPDSGFWAVTGHAQITEMSKDPAAFISSKGVLIGDVNREVSGNDSILYVDPPRHVTMRRIVNRGFTVRRVAQLAELVESIAATVFDDIDPTMPVDAIDAISAPIPLLIIAHMLGVPGEDLPTFRKWSDAIAIAATDPTDPRAMAAIDFFGYFNAKLDARIAEADPPEDLLTAITADAELTRSEQLGFCMSLLVAGNETTRHLISGGLLALAEHPDQRAALAADESLIPTAVEEMLRWVTPILAMGRTTACPVDLGGTQVAEDAYLVMLYAAANRDETVFGDTADAFDVTRSPNPHLAFGVGEHFCLGAQLARLEAKIVFTEILRRWPDYQVLDGVEMGASTLLRETLKLPILLQPQGA